MDKWTRIRFSPGLPLGEDGKRVTGCEEHIKISRNAAEEGMVLLKNNNKLLPLKKGTKVAVFGKGQYDYTHCGKGSGYVFSPYVINIYDGLKAKEAEGKLSVFDGLIDYYKKEIDEQRKTIVYPNAAREVAIPADALAKAKEITATAIITISRLSGEGHDRKGEHHDGDFYLDEMEEKMVKDVTDNFENVIVLINSGAQTDTEWYFENDKIDSVLYTWHGGMEGGLVIADILCGDVNPSGKLVDTFAKEFADYPSADTFNESEDYVKYYEDIYVGYRYFETLPDAKNRVNYPFGFGLSFTTFEITNMSATANDSKIVITADVTNTGDMSGKEVVQAYYSAPQGKLGKPAYELAGFIKTKELAPKETQTVTIEFDIDSMASYDDLGKIAKSAYLLEAGAYSFYVGNSIRNTEKLDYEYVSDTDTVTLQLQERCAPLALEKRMLSDGSFEKLEYKPVKRFNPDAPEFTAEAPKEKAMLIDVANGKVTMDEFIAQLDDDELISLTYGKPSRGVVNTSSMCGLEKYGVPEIPSADGPAGLRLMPNTGITTTGFPSATLLACTWNLEILENVGNAAAKEVKENNIGIWLAPALNIHRNPLCGRNFEYFSEDPLISGKMAAAIVRGVQSENIATSVKHFCVNNKEVNRKDSDSMVSERALREIYIKGFEICVKEADPRTIMSSYNMLNGIRTSENYELLTEILRGEWNYKGVVTTDWVTYGSQFEELRAGNDIKMPSGHHESVKSALWEGYLSRDQLRLCVKRILEMALKLD